MNTITISARISQKNKVEFFQTMESLKSLVKNYCNELETNIDSDNNLMIRISFSSEVELKNNFDNPEFNILKGTVRSLCEHVSITVDDEVANKI